MTRLYRPGSVHHHKGDEVRVIAYEDDTEMLSVVYSQTGQVWRLSLAKARRVLTPDSQVGES